MLAHQAHFHSPRHRVEQATHTRTHSLTYFYHRWIPSKISSLGSLLLPLIPSRHLSQFPSTLTSREAVGPHHAPSRERLFCHVSLRLARKFFPWESCRITSNFVLQATTHPYAIIYHPPLFVLTVSPLCPGFAERKWATLPFVLEPIRYYFRFKGSTGFCMYYQRLCSSFP